MYDWSKIEEGAKRAVQEKHLKEAGSEVKQESFGSLSKDEPIRSGWSTFFTRIGWLLLVLGFASFLFSFGARYSDQGTFLTVAIVGLAGGLQSLFFGFVINVFTDIRWYLQKIANKDS